jgi:hypothetical protein
VRSDPVLTRRESFRLHSLMVFCAITTYSGIYANSVLLQSFLVQGMALSKLLLLYFEMEYIALHRVNSDTYMQEG